jgi:hypothetical protein
MAFFIKRTSTKKELRGERMDKTVNERDKDFNKQIKLSKDIPVPGRGGP